MQGRPVKEAITLRREHELADRTAIVTGSTSTYYGDFEIVAADAALWDIY
jgi:hypothetical protein